MTFVPASSFEPATVVVSGTVAVSNFPASQPVTGPLTLAQLTAAEPLAVSGPLTDAQLAARLPLSISGAVTGPLTDAQLRAAAVPVSGPLTDAQLRATAVPVSAASLPLPTGAAKDSTLTDGTQRVGGTVTVDGSAVTQPISAESLPLPDGAADNATLSELALTAIIEREKMQLQ